jgi:BirA family biotin operon repressor/biotin-[acetyl-CoA-carboxylase] ligase
MTSNQFQGRGQQGARWFSEGQKSLTFSVYKVLENVAVKDFFYISMAVAVGIAETLIALNIPDVRVKWPNDIMSRGQKCGGILIENFLQRAIVKSSIIGVGLNVNNEIFSGLPFATSMKLASGQIINISEVLDKAVCNILNKLKLLDNSSYKELHHQYHELLFMRGKIQVFEDLNETRFNAIVKGVTSSGLLELQLESHGIKTYDLKEVKFCL